MIDGADGEPVAVQMESMGIAFRESLSAAKKKRLTRVP